MLSPTIPNSIQGEIFLMNLASDVPPEVDNLGFTLVFFFYDIFYHISNFVWFGNK